MVSKSKKAPPPKSGKAAKKVSGKKDEGPRNMGLGKLKGVFQERRQRLDAEIDRQSGGGKKKK